LLEFLEGVKAIAIHDGGTHHQHILVWNTSKFARLADSEASALVIDDSPTLTTLCRLLLSSVGIETQIANDADEALATLATESFGLILLDLEMPLTNGIALATKLKESTEGRDMPILALTNKDLGDCESDCRRAGIDGYIQKPIDIDKAMELAQFFGIKTNS
jgi:CheY-like chemotaxis protein